MTTLPLPRTVRRIAPLATLVTAALLLAGCGGGDDDTTTTKAATATAATAAGSLQTALADDVPAKAAAFAEITIRPQGDTKTAVDELSGMLGVDDPGAAIVKALDLDDKLDSGGTPEKDVLPHLGDHLAAFALASPTSSGKSGKAADAKAGGALVAEVTDAEALRKTLVPEIDKDGTEKIDVDGQTVYRKADGSIAAWFGDKLAAVGTEDAVRATIAATKGDTLADNERFKNALAQVRGSDAAGIAWVDLQQADTLNAAIQKASSQDELQDLAKKRSGELSQLGSGTDSLQKLAEQGAIPKIDAAVAIALQAKSGQIKVEAGGTGPADEKAVLGTGDAAKALALLPSGSWLALGASLSDMTALSGAEGSSPKDVLAQITRLTGTEFSPKLTDALGKIKTLAVAVRGDSLTSIGGAVVLQTTDAATATTLMDEVTSLAGKQGGLQFKKHAIPGADAGMTAQLGGFPAQLVIGTKGDHLAIGLGTDAVAGALGNGSTLADDPAYAKAKDLLGGDAPVLLLNPEPIANLMGSLPLGESSELSKVTDAIKRIKLVAASTARTSPTTWRGTFAVSYDPKPAAASGTGTTTTP